MQILVYGLATGLTIALVALAFQLVYLPTRVLHIALGAIYAIVPYTAWLCTSAGFPWPVTLALAVLCGSLLSAAIELINHRSLQRRNASLGSHIVSSIGIYIVLVQAIVVLYGNQPKSLAAGVDTLVRFSGVILTETQLATIAVSLGALGAIFLWLYRTDLGLQLRGLADNQRELALRGYSVFRLRLLAFGLSGFIAAIGALLSARELGFQPHVGLNAVILAVVATIIGGRSSFVGPVLGGVLLGLLRAQVVWLFSSRWEESFTFLVLALFLVFRPKGIIAKKARLEAEA